MTTHLCTKRRTRSGSRGSNGNGLLGLAVTAGQQAVSNGKADGMIVTDRITEYSSGSEVSVGGIHESGASDRAALLESPSAVLIGTSFNSSSFGWKREKFTPGARHPRLSAYPGGPLPRIRARRFPERYQPHL